MRAINAGIMKSVNRSIVLDWIRRGSISRAELAAKTELTRASITQIVDLLIRDGLVKETSAINRGRPGRKQTQLAIVGDSLCFGGVCMLYDRYFLSLMDLDGRMHWQEAGVITDCPVEAVLDEIAELVPAASPSDGFLKDTLNRFVRALGAEEQRIFLRRYWYGADIRELAEEHGCSETRIANILHRTRKKLRKHLEKEGYTL